MANRDGERITIEELRLFVRVVGYLFVHVPEDGPNVAEIARQQFDVARLDGVRYDAGQDLIGLYRCWPTKTDMEEAGATGGAWLIWESVQAYGLTMGVL